MIEVRLLKNNDEINDACALLYEVYIEHMKWNYTVNNSSKVKVITRDKKKILIDSFTYKSIWFGAFDGDVLIGCLRISGIDENNNLDIEYNTNSSKVWSYLPAPKTLCKDITKLAVRIAYPTKSLVIQRLFLSLFKYCLKKGYSTIAFTHDSYIKSLFTLIKFPLIIEHAFKYEDIDPMPVNFYRACFEKGEIDNIIGKLEYLVKMSKNSKLPSVTEMLEIIAPAIPALIYWHDINGVVLGLNQICLNEIGAKNFSDIIGKTPYDFYPKETAEHISNHNRQVIETGQILSQDESIHDIISGKLKTFKSIKAPLYDNNGNIVGIVGTSLNITAEKEMEELRIKNAINEEKLASQDIFKKCLDSIVSTIHNVQIELNSINSNTRVTTTIGDERIIPTERENQILYLLSINKSPKEIAKILSGKEGKILSVDTVRAMINKQLYPKFGVFNKTQLIEKANLLKLIPFIPDSLLI